ncbi:PP2C family protein-serine/threonine phosphatase [Lentzea sp. CC55]|uniref:PP2C family protein-serine/threonine phosphatase n=1 Tax=Lentzea sp. CC55 TaxID=2884909 RepID=UPI0027E000C6|nr:PP2C family protein-serine/threonine phosphatase [Lentzea sp. CC55]MCG8922985.1 SpoIIE family protein phosphatase [Lentzea sp. CC55]
MRAPVDAHEVTGDEVGVGRLAGTVARLRDEIEEARATADGRALVELAKGVLVERLRCGPAQAAEQLALLAERANTTQLQLAVEIVNEVSGDELTAPPLPDGRPDATAAVRLRTAESGALHADDTQSAAQSLFAHALAPLGASAVAIWLAGSDASLTLAGHAGFTPGEASRWRYVPPGVPTPARRALLGREAVWITDLRDSGLPSIGGDLPGRVTVPAGTGGRITGVLEICWPSALPPQPLSVHKQVEALAELCAATLDSTATARLADHGAPAPSELVDLADGLLDPALVLGPELSPDGTIADFRVHHVNGRFVDLAGRPRAAVAGKTLLEAYPLAAAGGGLFDKVEHVHATGEPFRTEHMDMAALIDEVSLPVTAGVSITRHGVLVLVVWRVQDETARLANLLQHAQRLGRVGGFEEDQHTGAIVWNSQLHALFGREPAAEPVPLAQIAAHAHPDDVLALNGFVQTVLHDHRSGSAAFRLQRPDGVTRHVRVIAEPVLDSHGTLLAVRGAYQDVSAQHWTEVALSATQDQLAITAQEAAEHNKLTLQLQQVIMPPTHPTLDAFGLRVGVRYRPAAQEELVGGDWYDAVVLPSKQILVSVGDITGHGIKGATGMVVLRNALRGLAATGAGPAQLLTWLNLVAHHLADTIFATAICGVYDPNTRVLRWARAGHLPPVLIRDGHGDLLPFLPGMMLGAMSEASYAEGEIVLERGDTLLLYTDGLVERRDVPLDECLEHLCEAVREPRADLDDLLDHLLALSESDTDDDTCVVGVQLP